MYLLGLDCIYLYWPPGMLCLVHRRDSRQAHWEMRERDERERVAVAKLSVGRAGEILL